MDVTVRVQGQPDVTLECVVDTGFEGALTLPKAAVEALALPYVTELSANLADGTDVRTDVHLATIRWHDTDVEVPVLALGQRPLLGTLLLDGSHLSIAFIDGGEVSVIPL
jgi:clan AA aspartic protease